METKTSAARSDLTYALAHAAKANHPTIVLEHTQANEIIIRRYLSSLRKDYDVRCADFNKVLPLAVVLAFTPLTVDVDAVRIRDSYATTMRVRDEAEGESWMNWWTPTRRRSTVG